MRCLACRLHGSTIGFVCAGCSRAIAALAHSAATLLPQHIVVDMRSPSQAVLLDQWGRTHPLAASAEIGRSSRSRGITILHATVSRCHARITRAQGSWRVVDTGSVNGTRVNSMRVTDQILADGDRIRFGAVGFYALLHIGTAVSGPEPVVTTSIQPASNVRCARPKQP
jgi:hypothetical protein